MKLPEYAFQFQLQFAMVAVVEHHDLAPKTIKNLTIRMSNLVKTKKKTISKIGFGIVKFRITSWRKKIRDKQFLIRSEKDKYILKNSLQTMLHSVC